MANPRSVLVVSDTPVGRRVCELLEMSGIGTILLEEPSDAELRDALTPEIEGVAVLLHDDVKVLRYSLAAHHIRPS